MSGSTPTPSAAAVPQAPSRPGVTAALVVAGLAALIAGPFLFYPVFVMTLTYALGAGLAAIAGVLAAPIYQVSPLMGSNIIIVVFAVVVVGGMGSIMGAIVTGYLLGIAEGLTKVFYPEASNIVIFVIMAIVLILRPAGLFGKEA